MSADIINKAKQERHACIVAEIDTILILLLGIFG